MVKMNKVPGKVQPKPPEKIPKTTFAGLFAATSAAMLGMGILLPIFSPYAKKLGASETMVGVIFAGFALARGIFGPLFGRISDKYGRKNILMLGLCLYAALPLGYTVTHSVLFLGVLWFFQGMASAMVTPIAQSYIGDITPQGQEGRVMNLFYLGLFGGVAIGPYLGGYLADHYSMNGPFYAMIAGALIGLSLVYFGVPESPKVEVPDDEVPGFFDSFKKVMQDTKMKGILYYITGRGFYRWGFNTFFPIYALSIASLTKSQVGLVISGYMVSGTVLQYPMGSLSDRFSKYRPEFVAFGGTLAALCMILVPSAHQFWLLIILVTGMGIFSAVSRASTVAIRTERGRYHGMGAVTGVFTAGLSLGQVIGPVGFGGITDILSIRAAFYVGAIAGLLTTAIAYIYLKHG